MNILQKENLMDYPKYFIQKANGESIDEVEYFVLRLDGGDRSAIMRRPSSQY